jgi:23S rRNA (guanosine2251-2'-O)-methyltransferase
MKPPYAPKRSNVRPPLKRTPYADSPKPIPKPDRDHPAPLRKPAPDNDLIFGLHSVAAALANPKRKLVHLWATENGLARLVEEAGDFTVATETLHPRHLDHMLAGDDAVHQGVILEAQPLKQPRLDQLPHDGIVVLLDQVTDPHNVGAILRSCAAFNVTALVSPARHSAAATGTLFKAASGAYEHVPMVTVTNLARAIDELKTYSFQIIGLDSEAETSIGPRDPALPTALVLGAEGKGLRQLTRQLCDQVVRLDMPGAIKSLNVSIAAAVTLYALTRQ